MIGPSVEEFDFIMFFQAFGKHQPLLFFFAYYVCVGYVSFILRLCCSFHLILVFCLLASDLSLMSCFLSFLSSLLLFNALYLSSWVFYLFHLRGLPFCGLALGFLLQTLKSSYLLRSRKLFLSFQIILCFSL